MDASKGIKNKEETSETDNITVENDDDEEDDLVAEVRAFRDVLAEQEIQTKKELENQTENEEEFNEKNKSTKEALERKIKEIQHNLPWMETLTVTSNTPLPFTSSKEVHDDLKREVIFFNTALESVQIAKHQFKAYHVPFTRPEDFYAEMIKSDEHMAKVKDRLLFESKKIAAFEQRKANRETKARSKEKKAKAQERKAQEKKNHFNSLQSMSRDIANNRGKNNTSEDMNKYFKNPRRLAADRKYGYGGSHKKEKGHFKSVDRAALNDFSEFNPRGTKASGGQKTSFKNNTSGSKRPGKRTRDAKRLKRK